MTEHALALIPWPARLNRLSGSRLFDRNVRPDVRFKDAPEFGREQYTLSITSDGVEILASSRAGQAYALQTLEQLLSAPGNGPLRLPHLLIEDAPRFAWRGFMLDVSRTFVPLEELLRYVDLLARFKLNVFHLHLTDDQGWRFECTRRPRLTEVGSRFASRFDQPEEWSGFYRRDQLERLVRHAAERNVTVIPEVDLPGHCRPALIAYPELSVSGKPTPAEILPWHEQERLPDGVARDALDPTHPEVLAFVDDLFAELAEIFPAPWIHIGADEVPFELWTGSPKIRARMRAAGIESGAELQSHFLRQVNGLAKAHGRGLLGWDEILKGGAPEGAAVMAWRGDASVRKALQAGRPTICCPNTALYLDQWQDSSRTRGSGFGELVSLRQTYEYEPTRDLPEPLSDSILGVQGNMWTHVARTRDEISFMVFPRLLAVAELGWSPRSSRDFGQFGLRLPPHLDRLEREGIHCYRGD